MAKAKKSKARKTKAKKSKTKKAKKSVRRAAAASRGKAKKTKAKKSTARKPKRAAAAKPKARAAKKTVSKAAPKKKKQIVGEGDYQASRSFLKDEANFVKRHSAEIPAMGKAAEAALEGPEGASLRAAEEEARSHSKAPE
jgi:hypothetical protein